MNLLQSTNPSNIFFQLCIEKSNNKRLENQLSYYTDRYESSLKDNSNLSSILLNQEKIRVSN